MASSTPSSPPTSLFRFAAAIVLVLGLTAAGLQWWAVWSVAHSGDIAPTTAPAVEPPQPVAYAPVLISLAIGIGLSVMLEGVARAVGRQPRRAGGPGGQGGHGQGGQGEVVAAVNQLASVVADLRLQMSESAMEIPQVQQRTVPAADPLVAQSLERMVKLLEELKELSLMDDSQRLARRQQGAARRRASKLEEAARMIDQRQWAQAEALLQLLESLDAKDAEVVALRRKLAGGRGAAASSDWDRVRREVEDLMAVSNFDTALAVAGRFSENFPDNQDGRILAERVRHEGTIFRDRTAGRMYDEIKTHIERRQWRRGLDVIQRMLNQFPDHGKSNKIRQQLHTIQANAEIEERQEQEERIQSLIKSKRFSDAVEMGEDLLARFPESPQAATLEELLPKLRALALEEDDGFDRMSRGNG